ncbi:SDR family NAD(P)-dependent oxidoreductase [Zwartia vadi]|uniref:SDR family NAD(P)-dependent oxidoreductase n=1 Tax=Zwartia vadi TaxID=3058168 RepID=UPI0025B2D809|nr:SDR family oxidoreductase [Zwartia vadi]MDN3988101.1 SDR family oxidoreductase [Zwartia vadi]
MSLTVKDHGIFSLVGHTALVTGASSGIGHHMAKTLSQAGAHVIVAARRIDKLQELVKEIQSTGGQATAVSLDVTDADSIKVCFDQIEASGLIADIIISNAGTTVAKPALDQTEADWDAVIDTNLKGCWMVDTEAARRLVKHKLKGSIINISSILGERVAGAVVGYVTSKAGVIQFTKALALEFARYGIRVNALLPGYVVTDLNSDFLSSEAGKKLESRVPFRRFCQMEDLDGPLLLLASNAGQAMTGSAIPVDWGHLVSSL